MVAVDEEVVGTEVGWIELVMEVEEVPEVERYEVVLEEEAGLIELVMAAAVLWDEEDIAVAAAVVVVAEKVWYEVVLVAVLEDCLAILEPFTEFLFEDTLSWLLQVSLALVTCTDIVRCSNEHSSLLPSGLICLEWWLFG